MTGETPVPFAVAQALAKTSALLLADDELDRFLDDLCQLTAGAMPGIASCGVTLALDGRPRTIAWTDERTKRIDDVQYLASDGPCVEALSTGEVVTMNNLTEETRWAAFRGGVDEQDLRCSMSLPLVRGDEHIGVLNCYGDAPYDYDSADHAIGALFATQVANAVTASMRYTSQVQLSEQLQQALASRAVIDQAIGILIAQNGCSPEEGFDMLRKASQRSNTKLRDVAANIVEGASNRKASD
jgi:GAF domain-containing protein